MLRSLGVVIALVALAPLAACIVNLDGLSGECAACGDAGDASRGDSSDASPSESGADCPSLHGPPAVRITTAAGSFCIDTTEVTAGQYAEFLAAKGSDTSGQPAECSANATFAPLDAPGSLPPNSAIGGVDWCDAHAFCAWAGKTLCGDFHGNALPIDDANDASKSAWYAACTMDGKNAYPYGSAFEPDACNAFDRTSKPSDVGRATCEGGYPGLFDMVGNVEEWVASCDRDTGENDGCLARGGHFSSTDERDLACATPSIHKETRLSAERWRGFRCCSTP